MHRTVQAALRLCALVNNHADRMQSLISQREGTLIIGTDPNEWWGSYDTFRRVTAAQVQEMKQAGLTFIPGNVQCYREGSVGWGTDQAKFRLADGSEMPVRLTMVFHQEQGEWKNRAVTLVARCLEW